MSVYAKMPCSNFGEVLHEVSYLRYAYCASQTPCEARSRVGVIRVNFDPVQEIGRKVGGGRSFVSGPFFARLRYRKRGDGILANVLIYLLGPVKT